MRILFNHGLTPGELYSNTPERVCTRKWTWITKTYGKTMTYEDALADPFRYCFGLILNRVIDDRVRFRVPVKTEGYIDFEIVDGDKFEFQRQKHIKKECLFI